MLLYLFLAFCALLLYFIVLSPLLRYLSLSLTFGFDKIHLHYRPFTGPLSHLIQNSKTYGHSYGFIFSAIQKNPLLKIIVLKMNFGVQLLILDVDLIKKMSSEFSKNLIKPNFIIFGNQIVRGLVFTEKEEWKKSRGIISDLFHFEVLRGREGVIREVVERRIQGLEKEVPNLFKLASGIGGEVVIRSLFGEDFFEVRFGGNNPFEEIQEILEEMVNETRKVHHILRMVVFGKVSSESRFLTKGQERLRVRLLGFKEVARRYLLEQKGKYEKKEPVAPFLEAYFKLNDESYHEEIIHQLFLFLFAGEDTTGSLIEKCLAHLAAYPQYQQRILADLQTSDPYSSKQLSNFINEINRSNSAVSLATTRWVQTPFTIDGYTFKKNDKIVLGITAPMMNPRYWDAPEVFNPDRWNKPIENHAAFIPFFSGPRNCIGQHMAMMEVKLTVAGVLGRYRLVKVGECKRSYSNTIINYLEDPYCVRFERKDE